MHKTGAMSNVELRWLVELTARSQRRTTAEFRDGGRTTADNDIDTQDTKRKKHWQRGSFYYPSHSAMNSHQIAPRENNSKDCHARRPSEPVAMRFHARPLPKRKSMTDVPQSSSSRLSGLLKRITRSTTTDSNQSMTLDEDEELDHDVRASWPSIRTDQQRESFGNRAQHAIFNAWTTLQRSSPSPLFTPPQFLLRTRRRISQSFNLKVVQAVGKDIRRSDSEWRNSFSDSRSSFGSTASWDDDTEPESLNLSERLSLTVGRHVSRDFAPMLTEGTALECRVREIVYSLLRNPKTLEGNTCHNFFTQQESFTSVRASACRHYLKRTRDTIRDVIQFIAEYRLRELRDELITLCCEPSDEAATHEIHDAVRRAVEEYFCFSMRYELRQWCITASEVDHRSKFKKTFAKWSTLDATSPEFGLKPQSDNTLIDEAIALLQEIDAIATPSRKMQRFLAACDNLSAVISGSPPSTDTIVPPSPTSRVCLGAADAFLPLLIFAVSRTKLRDPLFECAFLHGLYPFESEFGEEMYYLTMLEAALEFIRTHS